MPLVALQLTKETVFQGQEEEYSNVYTLDSGLVDLSDDWSGVAEQIATLEASITTISTEATRYTVWNIGGTQLDRVIIDAGDLGIPGTNAEQGLYRECAILVRWPLSRSAVLRRRRWLSKWIHCPYVPGASAGTFAGATALPQTALDFYQTNYVDPMLEGFDILGNGVVFSDSGGEEPGSGFVKSFMEHRQFHR